MASIDNIMRIRLDNTVYRKDFFALHPQLHDTDDLREMRAPKCPYCGKDHTAVFRYGRPLYSEESKRRIESSQIVLGGCCISETSPKYYCHDCKEGFGSPPILSTGRGMEDYRDLLNVVWFLDGGYDMGYPQLTIRRTRPGSHAEVIPPRFMKEDRKFFPVPDAEWNAIAYTLYNRLFIHEWKKEDYCDPTICDGEQWELCLRLKDGQERSFSGCNAFPAYWKELTDIFYPFFEKAGIRFY